MEKSYNQNKRWYSSLSVGRNEEEKSRKSEDKTKDDSLITEVIEERKIKVESDVTEKSLILECEDTQGKSDTDQNSLNFLTWKIHKLQRVKANIWNYWPKIQKIKVNPTWKGTAKDKIKWDFKMRIKLIVLPISLSC